MRWIWVSGLLLWAITVVAVGAGTRVRIVRIGFLSHQVETRSAPAPGAAAPWRAAVPGAPMAEGESLRTGAQGEAEVDLECGSALRLAPNSSFEFTRLRLRDDGVDTTAVTLTSGVAYFNLGHLDSRDFTVSVAGATVEWPDGASQLRVEAPSAGADVASVSVLGGRARLAVDGGVHEMKKSMRLGWTATGQVSRLPSAPPTAADTWNRQRNRQFAIEVLNARMKEQVAAEQAEQAQENGITAPPSQIGEGPEQDVRGIGITSQLAMGDANYGENATAPAASAPSTVPDCALY